MNLAYHHISGAGAWWWPGLTRLDCTTNTDITYYHLIKGSLLQTDKDHCEAQAETDTESTIRLKLIPSHKRNKQRGLEWVGADSVISLCLLF